jgi:D-alanyl-D-alanine carboxypeptidase/D-alanyl-D-alanine-endopeptidase (penicillin-binding protein 4)
MPRSPIARHRTAAIVISLILALPPIQAQAASPLPTTVAHALTQAGIPLSAVGIVVQPVDAPTPRLQLNATQAFNPASTIKLLTTYVALEQLGPAYTWPTEAWAHAQPVDGHLTGNLILRGSGDPRLDLDRFTGLLRELRAHGVREIHGNLQLDRSLFEAYPPDTPPADFDDQPLRPYNVRPDALLLNYNSLRLHLTGDAAHKRLTIHTEPELDNLEIVQRIEPLPGECPPGSAWRNRLTAQVSPLNTPQPPPQMPRYQLTLGGGYPLSCGEHDWHLSVLPQAQYVYGVFSQRWRELGGRFNGRLDTTPPPADAPLQRLARTESPPLAEIIRDINKYSNNVMARQLLLTLGAETGARPARPADGSRALTVWLEHQALHFPELILENGAGLSRIERIAPASLARLLNHAWQSPLMPEFIASLPLAAIDGTMKKRLNGQGIHGQAHIKTGSLEGVSAIAGYVRDRRGKWQIVIFMANHPQAAKSRAAQDALLEWIYEQTSQAEHNASTPASSSKISP